MIIKQAFLGIFHEIMVFCIAMTMFVFTAHATIPSEYVQIIPDDTTQYPETLTGYTINMLNNGYFNSGLTGNDGNPSYVRKTLSSSNITVSGTGVYTAFVQGVPARTNSVNGINIYATSSGTTYIRLRYIGTDMWGNDVNITTTSQADNYFSSNPTPVLYKITTTTNNVHVAAKRISDGVFGYYCTSGDCVATNNNAQVKFIPVYGMTGTVNPCPGGTLQTYTTVAATDVPAGVQNGTPTPTNPIEPVFYTQGNMVLRKVGDYADSYDATTGKITRRVGVKVFDGTEDWIVSSVSSVRYVLLETTTDNTRYGIISSHFKSDPVSFANMSNNSGSMTRIAAEGKKAIALKAESYATLNDWKQYLADQYAAGTPVTVYYPLATPVEEDWAAEQCDMPIKIATRAYNTTQFAPVVSALNTAIDTIKDVVTNTINQTAAVSALQSTKQTRPDEECPAGKKCLLVEDTNGNPHWYEIIDCSADNVLAGMRFVEENVAFGIGEMWGVQTSQGSSSLMCVHDAIACQNGEWVTSYDTSSATHIGNEIVFGIARNVSITERTRGSIVRLPDDVPTGNVCVCKATRYQLWDSGTSAYGADHNIDTDSWFVAGIETSNGNDCLNLCGDDRTNDISKESYFQYISNSCNANVAVANSYLPAGYTPLEYIQSTGTQYIDTGAVYKSSRIYNVDFQYVAYPDGAKGVLGARKTSTAGTGTFDIGCNQTLFYFYNNSTSANVREPRDLARHTVEIDYTNSVFKFDGETLPWNTGTGAWQGTYNIYIGRENIAGSPNTSVGTVKWYSYKVYDNGTLVQDLVPAKNASGVIGMYDLADPNPATAFHTNQGTGTFTAGPEI